MTRGKERPFTQTHCGNKLDAQLTRSDKQNVNVWKKGWTGKGAWDIARAYERGYGGRNGGRMRGRQMEEGKMNGLD